MQVDLIEHMGSDLMVVNAARVSFAKHKTELDAADIKLLHYLAKNHHWTPFGHPHVCFRVEFPIFVARQLIRHNVGLVVNEESRRYIESEPMFHIPGEQSGWRMRPQGSKKQGSSGPANLTTMRIATQTVEDATKVAKLAYQGLLSLGIAPEQARMILPLNTMTSWYWTGSLAAFHRVCHLRLSPDAQDETRWVADAINTHLMGLYPHAMAALRIEQPIDNHFQSNLGVS